MLGRVGEYGHTAEATVDEVLSATAGGSEGRVFGDHKEKEGAQP